MQVTPAIHALRHPFQVPVAPGITLDRFVNSYLIPGETIPLIDTGVAGYETRIFEYIRSICRDPSDISLVILTHSHPDHIGAARAIRELSRRQLPMEISYRENFHMNGCICMRCRDSSGKIPGEHNRCQYENTKNAEPQKNLQFDRDRVLPGIGCHYNESLVCDQLIAECPGEKRGRYGVFVDHMDVRTVSNQLLNSLLNSRIRSTSSKVRREIFSE